VARLRGPKAQHELYLDRIMRWGRGEQEWRILDHLVDPSRSAIDVGANDGDYSGRLAQHCTKVYAFEPIPWLAGDVIRKCPANVVVHREALSNHAGHAESRIPTRNGLEDSGRTTMQEHNPLEDGDSVRIVPCVLDRLDNFNFHRVGFIKIDVEDHELSVLEGAIETIRAHRPFLLVESVRAHNPSSPESVFDFLRKEGYVPLYLAGTVLRAIGKSRPAGSGPDYIFVPQDETSAEGDA
jgi:FkbM family methyltransferase